MVRVPSSAKVAIALFAFAAGSLEAAPAAAEEEAFEVGYVTGHCHAGHCCTIWGGAYSGCRTECGNGPLAQGAFIDYPSMKCTGTTDCSW